ncbi:MAG: L-threonylcarbamoyladenylate synthase [Muribaculaceae bacterium]
MTTDLYTDDIRAAVETLRRGGIILYPTDTVWGIGCDATNAAAVARVFDIKRRTDAKALITLVDSVAALERIVPDIPDAAYQLIDVAVEPLTIVYDSARGVAPQLLAADGSIGVRITAEPFSRRLCHTLRKPLVSTSANVSGAPTPLCFNDITPQIIQAVDYVCLSRRDEPPAAKASTIIKVSAGNVIHLIRK